MLKIDPATTTMYGEAGYERIGRTEALERGLPRYFTGRACRRGHISWRQTVNFTCIECANAADRRYRRLNVEAARAKDRARYHANPERMKRSSRRAYIKHREKRIAEAAVWQKKNRERVNQKNRLWRQNNAGAVNAKTAARRARLSRAMPPWLTSEQRQAMRRLYIEASRRGLHVDHIVPLNGNLVCGLHVPWNLALIPPLENLRKSNKFRGGA